MVRHLTEKTLLKVSSLTKVPMDKLVLLDSMGLLDHKRVLGMAIKRDWQILAKRPQHYTKSQMAQALATEYNVTESFVNTSVRTCRDGAYYCKECGVEMDRKDFLRNKGYCDHCIVKSIKINDE